MSKLYVHPVTGNVGIGTDKPEGILDIKSVITNAVFPPPGMSNVVAVPDYTNMVTSIDVGNMPTLVEYPPPFYIGATQSVADTTVSGVTQSTITVAGSTYGNGAYVAIASSEWSTSYKAARAFNKSLTNINIDSWASVNSARYAGVDNTYSGAVITTSNGVNLAGEWVQLLLPSPIALKSYTLTIGQAVDQVNASPIKWWLVGSTNGTSWTLLDSRSNITWGASFQSRTFIVDNDIAYGYYRIICNQVRSPSIYVCIFEWQLSADSTYSTVREFPPGPMYDDQMDLWAMYGGGRYVASASSQFDINAIYSPCKAFDKSASTSYVTKDFVYNASGVYTGTVSTQTLTGAVYAGEWVQLQLPYPIILTSYQIVLSAVYLAPKQWYLLASTTGIDWTLIDSQASQTTWTAGVYKTFILTISSAFNYFRIVVSTTNTTGVASGGLTEWKLFGSLHQKYPKLTLPLLGSQSTYGTGSYKAYANTLYNPGTPIAGNPTNAIDANAATFWRSGSNLYTSVIDASPVPTVYFEFPDGLKATSYALTARQNAVTAFDEAPGKWNLYGSNMAAVGSWALLDARANISTWAAENPKTFALTGNTTFYNAYKLEVLRNNSASGNFITIRDVQWIGDKQTPDTKLMITTGGRIGMNALASSDYMLNVDGNIRATGDLIANGYVMGLPKMAIIQDRKPYNVNAASGVVGVNTRELNTIVIDTIGITLVNNKFVLPAGTYHISASASAYAGDRHQLRLRNITNNTTTSLGSVELSNATYYGNTRSFIDDVFTIISISSFELQHFITSAGGSFGTQNLSAYFDNVYACVKLIRFT